MANFGIAYKRTNIWEGFYSNNPNDSGGETLYGISRVKGTAFPEFWKLVDQFKLQPNFPNNMAGNQQLIKMKTDWYKRNYWDVFKGDDIKNQGIANQLYDISVNKGQPTAVRFLHSALNAKSSTIVNNAIIQQLNEIDKNNIDWIDVDRV